MSTRQLMRIIKGPTVPNGPSMLEAAVELHQRFTFPVACVMLALVGIPLGIATRKGGKSASYLIALFLGFFGYWNFSSITLQNIAKQRSLPVPVALWLPNAIFGIAGVIFLSRIERPGDQDLLAWLQGTVRRAVRLVQAKASPRKRFLEPSRGGGFPCFRSWSTLMCCRISCSTSG